MGVSECERTVSRGKEDCMICIVVPGREREYDGDAAMMKGLLS